MFLHQVKFEVDLQHIEAWTAYQRTCFAVLARQPGAVLLRLLRDPKQPHKFIALATWTTREQQRRAFDSQEFDMVRQPSRETQFYQGERKAADYELTDFVWGLAGPDGPRPGAIVYHVESHARPDKMRLWRQYRRNFHSIMARLTEPICYETSGSYVEEHLGLTLRTYPSREAGQIALAAGMIPEVRLAAKPNQDHELFKGMPRSVVLETELFDILWGLDGLERLHAFTRSLQSL